MTGLLLDTHVWLWSLLEPQRLGTQARARMTDPDTSLWLSPISVWEAYLLGERGRLAVSGPIGPWLRVALAASPVREAPLSSAIALRSRELDLSHADPADRFLLATAEVLGLDFATADQHLRTARATTIVRADR